MILRRLATAFRKQDWFTVAVETLIVVFGVFIGLQVNNWNASRADMMSERHYLVQLRQDFKLIQSEVRDQIEFEQFQSRIVREIASEIVEPGEHAERRIGVGLSFLAKRRTLKVDSPTFLDLQSSGNLEIISDPDLRAAIIAFFYRAGRLEAAIDKNNQFYVDQGLRDFLRNEGLRFYEWDSVLMGAPMLASVAYTAGVSDTAISRMASADAAILVLDSPDLKDKIIAQLSWRASGSLSNESMARLMLEGVQAIDQTLAAHIDEVAP